MLDLNLQLASVFFPLLFHSVRSITDNEMFIGDLHVWTTRRCDDSTRFSKELIGCSLERWLHTNLLLKKKRSIRWDGNLIEILGKTVNGWKILRELAKLKPELAVLLPP